MTDQYDDGFHDGAASRQAEIDAIRGGVGAVLRECLNMNHQDIISALRHVLNSSATTGN